jgi:filamentous hemagglutinin family protein
MRFAALSLVSLVLLSWSIGAQAQITPDTTLTNPSIATPNGNIQTITGGTIGAGNLFHSFSQFSVPTGNTARFIHPPTTRNLFVRITGNIASNINGVVQTRADNNNTQPSSANLFLLNPNGIIFGRDARLDLRGSFLASTADRILLSNGSEFSARNPTTPLLTIATPIGLQFGNNPGILENRSRATLPNSSQALGLQVVNGKTLALIGGTVTVDNGILLANPGNIEIAAIGSNQSTDFTLQENGRLSFDYSKTNSFQDIIFSNQSRLQLVASATAVKLTGQNITLQSGAQIASDAVSSSNTPENVIAITAKNNLSITGSGSTIISAASVAGKGSEININVKNLILEERGNIRTLVQRLGSQGGNITINASEQITLNGIQLTREQGNIANTGLFANSFNAGASGNITVSGRILAMQNGANLNSITSGVGKSGDVTLKNFDEITVSGAIIKSTEPPIVNGLLGLPTIISTKTQGPGDAGQLTIATKRLKVLDGAQIITSTTSSGNAGLLDIQAQEIEMGGIATANNQLLYQAPSNRLASNIAADAQPGSTGRGANLQIKTDRLTIRDGAVLQGATFSSGDAGDITVVANQSILLEGRAPNPDDRFPSSIIAISGGLPGETVFGVPTATGKGGNISLRTPELKLTNGAQIALGSLNKTAAAKGAGDELRIDANTITLDRAKLNAETNAGDGGNMVINARDLLLLRNGSKILTIAGSADQPGNGGNIAIKTPLIVARDIEDSDIRADSFSGSGGRIDLNVTSSILGLTIRPQNTELSDITSSSRFGQPGIISLVTPDIDPNRGTTQLPIAPNDAANRIDQSCSANSTIANNRFTVQGSGGLPATPGSPISTPPIARLANLPTVIQTSTQPASNLTIREAQQIQRLANGKIRFRIDANHPTETLRLQSGCQ